MRGLTRKIVVKGFLGLILIASGVSHAGINPFKKSKNYNFGPEVAWYENAESAIKSGSVQDGSNINYYHLNIDKFRLLLRLGKNDPSGELENTRVLDAMAISDVMVDGKRLPVFNWCLQNQQSPSKKLKQNAVVANDTCVNAGGGGDFVINLDESTKDILKNARSLEFLIEPYGRPVKLFYSMAGFAPIMAQLDKPEPPVVINPAPAPVATVKPAPRPVPKPKPKAKPQPKPVKMCYAKPPANFKSAVKGIAYPCEDNAKKSAAEQKISAQVEHEKKKMAAELAASKKEKMERQKKAVETDKQQSKWDEQQSALWVSRCKRHWDKGRSPCYCEKYMDQAPAGVTNTCGR